MKYKFFICLWMILSLHSNCASQLAIGVAPIMRFSDDRVGQTYNLGIVGQLYEDSAIFTRIGFAASFPVYVNGTAQLDAFDSVTVPFTISIRARQKILDYILHASGGVCINPKKKKNSFVFTFGLRLVVRTVGVKYLETFDKNLYNTKPESRNPNIPAAINIGFNLGLGYEIKFKRLLLFPEFSLGFGSADYFGKHPWNSFPNYGEFGLGIMFVSKK